MVFIVKHGTTKYENLEVVGIDQLKLNERMVIHENINFYKKYHIFIQEFDRVTQRKHVVYVQTFKRDNKSFDFILIDRSGNMNLAKNKKKEMDVDCRIKLIFRASKKTRLRRIDLVDMYWKQVYASFDHGNFEVKITQRDIGKIYSLFCWIIIAVPLLLVILGSIIRNPRRAFRLCKNLCKMCLYSCKRGSK
ncbi:hypothetical protein SNEBB_008611 [Seison nebaliae]|nr:hypothetical protein SNEBB_008611 [Seison nebaliae]